MQEAAGVISRGVSTTLRELPFTGAEAVAQLVGASLLLAAGLLLARLARRQKRRASSG
jgi:hypothetical protein